MGNDKEKEKEIINALSDAMSEHRPFPIKDLAGNFIIVGFSVDERGGFVELKRYFSKTEVEFILKALKNAE